MFDMFLWRGIQDCLISSDVWVLPSFTMFHLSTTFPSIANDVSDEFVADCIASKCFSKKHQRPAKPS